MKSGELSDLMTEEDLPLYESGLSKIGYERLEKSYEKREKHTFLVSTPFFKEDLKVEYVLINSSERPHNEDSPAFAISRGINFLCTFGPKIFICEDLIPDKKFFRYLAIHEAMETRSCHSTANEVEMARAAEELNDEELRAYCQFRAGDKTLKPSYAKHIWEKLPERVRQILEPISK